MLKIFIYNYNFEDEDIQQLLTELNDTAIQALKNEDNENSLECLKRGE